MPSTQALFDLLLPSLVSLGLWSYWLIGLAALIEAFFVTGIILPGSLVVILGGALVQRGDLDFGDLTWFVAAGSWIGGVLSFLLGARQRERRAARRDLLKPQSFRFAARFFQRQGGLAIVLGRFAGPVSGLVPFAAALAGMRPRTFLIWNTVGALPYALVYIAVGYGLGEVLDRVGPLMTRIGLTLAVAALGLGLASYLISQMLRGLPLLLGLLSLEIRSYLQRPAVVAWQSRHPRLMRFVVARLDPAEFSGRTLTLLVLSMVYVLSVYIASVQDLIMSEQIVQVDTRLAALIHAFQIPGAIRVAAYVTALGDWRAVGILFAGMLIALVLRGRLALGAGLMVAVAGDLATVWLLKAA
ncbi:MAG: DedA family protein, partial [Paracoccaceae bacterium]